jgi:hypothetical protein
VPQERLSLAVDALASSASPIQQRLLHAGITLVPLLPEDFDDGEQREEFVSIMAALSAVEPVGDEGALEATTAAMSDDEAVALASRISTLDRAVRPVT